MIGERITYSGYWPPIRDYNQQHESDNESAQNAMSDRHLCPSDVWLGSVLSIFGQRERSMSFEDEGDRTFVNNLSSNYMPPER